MGAQPFFPVAAVGPRIGLAPLLFFDCRRRSFWLPAEETNAALLPKESEASDGSTCAFA
jgi:hypothetical protein